MVQPGILPARHGGLAKIEVKTTAFGNNQPIPAKYAFGQPDGKGRVKDAGNLNPSLSWSGAPKGTKSYAIIVVDRDVPAKFDDANQEGKTIAADFPRRNFYHWVLFDIPVGITSIKEGETSSGVVQGGKPTGKTPHGITGPNDFALFGGSHGGYDGPCPPWNDARLHHYHFIVYALDIPTLGLTGTAKGEDVESTMQGHVLAQGEVVGTYTTYLPLLKK